MYRAVVLIAFIYVVLVAADEDLEKKCFKFNRNAWHCCTTKIKNPGPVPKSEVMECVSKYPPSSCQAEECIAKKIGYSDPNGKLDIKAFTSFVDKKFEENQDLLDVIKENCLKADILNQGSPDVCDFKKMNFCIIKQFVETCPEWSNEEDCDATEIKELVGVCTSH